MRLPPGGPVVDVEQRSRKNTTMNLVVERCCGLEVHKDTVVACVHTAGKGGKRHQETRTFGTMTIDLLALRDWLVALGVTLVGMESTGIYWKAPFYVCHRRPRRSVLTQGEPVTYGIDGPGAGQVCLKLSASVVLDAGEMSVRARTHRRICRSPTLRRLPCSGMRGTNRAVVCSCRWSSRLLCRDDAA